MKTLESIIKSGKKAIATGLTLIAVGLTTPYCGGDNNPTPTPTPVVYQCNNSIDDDGDNLIDMADPGCSSATDNDEAPTATEYVNKWLPTNKVCLNYNEIVAMVNGETGISSYVDKLAIEINDCVATNYGPTCPLTGGFDSKADLISYSNSLLGDCEFHNGNPRPFYIEKNIDIDGNGALEYNWDCPIQQTPMIFTIKPEHITNIYNYIKEFLILYVDKHKNNYNDLNLDSNPNWDNCFL